MVSYNLLFLIVLLLFVVLVYFGNGEPDPEPGSLKERRGLSTNKKINDHQMIFTLKNPNDQGDDDNNNEITKVSFGNDTKFRNNSTGSSLKFPNSNLTHANNTSSSPTPENSPIDISPSPEGLEVPKVDLAGFGWDSEMTRIIQVIIGLSFYLLALFIKGLLLSWGISEIKRQVVDKISTSVGMDTLFDLVQFGIMEAGKKYLG